MINGALEGDVFYGRPGVAVVAWDQESRAVYIDWQSWADPDEFELLLEAGITYFGTVESATEWLTGSLSIVNGELDID